jgi:hypothetical protein
METRADEAWRSKSLSPRNQKNAGSWMDAALLWLSGHEKTYEVPVAGNQVGRLPVESTGKPIIQEKQFEAALGITDPRRVNETSDTPRSTHSKFKRTVIKIRAPRSFS